MRVYWRVVNNVKVTCPLDTSIWRNSHDVTLTYGLSFFPVSVCWWSRIVISFERKSCEVEMWMILECDGECKESWMVATRQTSFRERKGVYNFGVPRWQVLLVMNLGTLRSIYVPNGSMELRVKLSKDKCLIRCYGMWSGKKPIGVMIYLITMIVLLSAC